MAHPTGRKRLPAHVVLDVRRGHDHGPRTRRAEHGVLQSGQPGQVQVLDDLAEHGGVASLEPLVRVRERTLLERHPARLALPQPLQLQPPRREGEGAHRHVDADDLGEAHVLEECLHQLALSAAQIEDAARPGGAQRTEDRGAPLLGERNGPLLGVGALVHRVVDAVHVEVVGLGEARQLQGLRGPPGEPPAVGEVAPGDQVAFGVSGQPALTGPQQLVHLVGRHPVVLGVVEHRQQDVELAQGVGQPQLALPPPGNFSAPAAPTDPRSAPAPPGSSLRRAGPPPRSRPAPAPGRTCSAPSTASLRRPTPPRCSDRPRPACR
ncbi:hypothetical protein EES43_23390 [Streptomyces sp. ADI96-02]|nr:hypothetical protein EES43_23390 [Streptomyces sp. ADI96-02]